MTSDEGWHQIYERSWAGYLLDVFGGLVLLPFGAMVFCGPAYLLATSLGLLPALDGKPAPLASVVVGALFGLPLGGLMLREGGGYLLGLLTPALQHEGQVENLKVHSGTQGRSYSVTIAGVTYDAPKRLHQSLRLHQPVRVLRSRGSRELLRVWTRPG